MAVTATASTVRNKQVDIRGDSVTPFFVNAYSADWSGTEEIKAAPASGSIAITKLTVSGVAKDCTVTIGAGETGGAVTTIVWGPLAFPTETTGAGYIPATQYVLEPKTPIILTATTSLTADATAAGAVTITAEGYIIS